MSLNDEILNKAMLFFDSIHNSAGNELVELDNEKDLSSYFYKPFNINLPESRNRFFNLIRNRINIRYFRIDVIIPFLSKSKKTYFLKNEKGKSTTFIFGEIYNGKFWYKPYFSSNGKGIIDNIINQQPNSIRLILKDLNKLLTFSSKCFSVDKEENLWDMMELFLLLITTERFRSDQSNIIAYIEFFKAKRMNDDYIKEIMKKMFDPENPTLKFAQKGGVKSILNMRPETIFQYFIDMINFIEDKDFQFDCSDKSVCNFYEKHLEKLKAIIENRYPCSNNDDESDEQFSIKRVKIWATPIDEKDFQKSVRKSYYQKFSLFHK